MTVAKIKKELMRFLFRKPFEPFRVVLNDGERLEVTRQFQLGFGLSAFGYAVSMRGPVLQRRLRQIVSIEPMHSAGATAGTASK